MGIGAVAFFLVVVVVVVGGFWDYSVPRHNL